MLIDRNVVRRSGVPPRYRYTDAGAALWPVIDALDDLCDCCEGSDSLTSE
jgi:DNA-binding HxlR family transcriptional regulator